MLKVRGRQFAVMPRSDVPVCRFADNCLLHAFFFLKEVFGKFWPRIWEGCELGSVAVNAGICMRALLLATLDAMDACSMLLSGDQTDMCALVSRVCFASEERILFNAQQILFYFVALLFTQW